MRIEVTESGVTLIREAGDKRIGKESTVVFHLRNLLNEQDERKGRDGKSLRGGYAGDGRAGTWRRFHPNKVGLTSCRLGVWNGRQGKGQIAYWHERHAIENAREEFNNQGKVFFMKAVTR